MIDVGVLLFATVAWLGVLAAIALAAQRARLLRSLFVLALSLGVYASSWTYYGSVGFAQRHGLVFLAVYLGPTLACLATPLLWARVLRITREQRLSSLTDLLAFRFQSLAAGALVAAFALVASLPYVAQQFRATVQSVRVLSGSGHEEAVGAVFCALLALFTAFFGTRPSAEHGRGRTASRRRSRSSRRRSSPCSRPWASPPCSGRSAGSAGSRARARLSWRTRASPPGQR
ncbi:hypothetical protein WME94_06610 [Sorangium sp. So ce429]